MNVSELRTSECLMRFGANIYFSSQHVGLFHESNNLSLFFCEHRNDVSQFGKASLIESSKILLMSAKIHYKIVEQRSVTKNSL